MVVMGLQKGTMPQELLKKRPQPWKRQGAKPKSFCSLFCQILQ